MPGGTPWLAGERPLGPGGKGTEGVEKVLALRDRQMAQLLQSLSGQLCSAGDLQSRAWWLGGHRPMVQAPPAVFSLSLAHGNL